MFQKSIKRLRATSLAVILTMNPIASFAYDWTVVGHVTLIEPSNVPA